MPRGEVIGPRLSEEPQEFFHPLEVCFEKGKVAVGKPEFLVDGKFRAGLKFCGAGTFVSDDGPLSDDEMHGCPVISA